jgi:GNAT superfamily N-acetyltransferase
VAVIRELAENANTYTPLAPDEERVANDRFVIAFGAGSDPHFTVVQRLRLGDDDVDDAVGEIRALVRSRGRSACTWEVGDSATPADLVERLLARGCEPDREPLAMGMVLTEPPADDAPAVTARRVETLAEYEAAIRIAHTAFEAPAESTAEALARAEQDYAREGDQWRTYLAFLDGRPVARATAQFTEHGVLLFGGATLPEARGRGVYRALVRVRWDDAVAHGTPVLVTHAGAMSRPILRSLGFREVAQVHILLDRFDQG